MKQSTYFDQADYPLPQSLYQATGLGLRPGLYSHFMHDPLPKLGWLEVHPENYFGGGYHRQFLSHIRKNYPLSFHAVGLSLGSDQPVNLQHLQQLKELVNIYEPFLVSDHVSWSATGNAHLNDLLPLPYTTESLNRIIDNINRVQDTLNRTILVENPSSYLSFTVDEMPEYDFMNRIAEKTGCGILLDVNNIFVQASNHNTSANQYLSEIKTQFVQEIHLAGHTKKEFKNGTLLIDTHNQLICQGVWELFKQAITRFGSKPTLIEWDSDFPEFQTLQAQVNQAQNTIEKVLTAQHAA